MSPSTEQILYGETFLSASGESVEGLADTNSVRVEQNVLTFRVWEKYKPGMIQAGHKKIVWIFRKPASAKLVYDEIQNHLWKSSLRNSDL